MGNDGAQLGSKSLRSRYAKINDGRFVVHACVTACVLLAVRIKAKNKTKKPTKKRAGLICVLIELKEAAGRGYKDNKM